MIRSFKDSNSKVGASVRTGVPMLVLLGILSVARGSDSANLQATEASAANQLTNAMALAQPAKAVSRRAPAPVAASRLVLEPVAVKPAPHVLDGLSSFEVARLLAQQPEKLGPASLGRPNRGGLLNGVQLRSAPGLSVRDPARSFGTSVTVNSIQAAAAEVLRQFPGSASIEVGDISRARGGYLRPHRSHQSGRDVDLGYYYLGTARWYTKVTPENLDRARSWAFLKALITQGSVEYVFMDRTVQALLREHAEAAGESAAFLDEVFESRGRKTTLVRHARGHRTHLHVRFFDPAAEETGKRLSARPRRASRM